MVKDSIADLITSIKNASERGKEQIIFPFSNLHMAIAETLIRGGFVQSVGKKGKKIAKFLEIKLGYASDGRPKVAGVRRVSKFSRRVYSKVSDFKPVRVGFGTKVLSTTKGIMMDREAKKLGIGGEGLFEIW